MGNLWSARFQTEPDEKLKAFNSSIAVDGLMYIEDIEGSIAHATMLAEQGIISKDDADKIIAG